MNSKAVIAVIDSENRRVTHEWDAFKGGEAESVALAETQGKRLVARLAALGVTLKDLEPR